MNQILKPSIDKNDYIECEYCKNKLYRKTIEWQLYGDKKVLTLDYERCNCKEAKVYWNEYDLKKIVDENEMYVYNCMAYRKNLTSEYAAQRLIEIFNTRKGKETF